MSNRQETIIQQLEMTYDAKQTAKLARLGGYIETIAALASAALEQNGDFDPQADSLKAIATYTEIAQRLNAELAADNVD
jgi:hypothetical protein